MPKDMCKAFAYVDATRDQTIDLYRKFVNQKSWSRQKDAVKAFSDLLKAEMEKEGFVCKYLPVGGPANEPRADLLVGTLGADRPGKPVLFIGHMDTVFPPEMHEENPFYIDESCMLSMKTPMAIPSILVLFPAVQYPMQCPNTAKRCWISGTAAGKVERLS